jgi:hypothetical protein
MKYWIITIKHHENCFDYEMGHLETFKVKGSIVDYLETNYTSTHVILLNHLEITEEEYKTFGHNCLSKRVEV